MRSLCFIALPALTWSAACSTPDRGFDPSEPAASSTTASSATASSATAATSSSTAPPGSGGDGGSSSASQGGGDPSSGGGGASSQGGGIPADCGNGVLDPGEACDDPTSLCVDCQVECPADDAGWAQIGNRCFAVALMDTNPYEALAADAKCGAISARDHRAHAAVPVNFEELDALATRCPGNGCWLGYYALGMPGDAVFTAPSNGATLPEDLPWNEGEPSRGDDELCLKVVNLSGQPALEDHPCDVSAYFACEVEPEYGDNRACGDGVTDPDEDCDGGADCLGCDRQCAAGWVEDPRTHACLTTLSTLTSWGSAQELCEGAGAALATPDEIADVRIASVVTSDAWIGLDATDSPAWLSGERFQYAAPAYPMPVGPTDASYGVLGGGEIGFDLPGNAHDALCEQFDPGL